jgi:hypothetical protein
VPRDEKPNIRIHEARWDEPDSALDDRRVKLSRLGDWAHLCTVDPVRVDALDTLGIVPTVLLPYWGGVTSPTSTDAVSKVTMANHPSRPTHS